MSRDQLLEQNLVANERVSIDEALRLITDNQRGALVVVDDDFTYRGVVSDGEIRRAFVHGATQLAPISKIVNPNARTVSADAREEADAVFAAYPEITLVPVIGKGNVLLDVIMRDRARRKT